MLLWDINAKVYEKEAKTEVPRDVRISKSPETRQVQEILVSTLEHLQVPKWDRTRCPEE